MKKNAMKRNFSIGCLKSFKIPLKLMMATLLLSFSLTQTIAAQGTPSTNDTLDELVLEEIQEQNLQSFQQIRQEAFDITLTGTQENPAITVRSFGSAKARLIGNTLIVAGSFTGLEGDLATQLAGGGHIHEGLAGTNGVISGTAGSVSEGGPALLLNITPDSTNRNGTFVNVSKLTNAQVGLLRARSLYINIHSQVNLGGELRGQILPASDASLLANMSGANEVPSIVAASSGNIVFDLLGNTLTASGSFSGLEGDIAVDLAGGAHIHDAVAGRNGQISVLLNIKAGADNRSGMFIASENTFELTDAQVALLLSQGNYVNIHSQTNRGGELRGQIAPLTNAAFRVQLSGIQEVPTAVNTTANGRLLVSYNTENNQLVVSGSYNGLQGTLATDLAGGIHLHTGITGNNGPVTVLLNTTADDANNGVFLPENNTFNLNDSGVIVAQGVTPDSFVEALFERGIYTNIHSSEFRGGELRGQLLPLAQGYFATNLESRNEIPLAISDAFGNIQFELRGNQLISSGSFSNLSSALNVELAGGAHGHLGNANQTGGIQFLLNTTPSGNNVSGVFEAANNIVDLTDEQREALLTGNIYINVHSLNNAPGEIRGQVLRDDNRFPSASTITNADVALSADNSSLEVSWEEATDLDEDLVVYTLQASLDDNFDALLLNEKLAETTFTATAEQIVALTEALENDDDGVLNVNFRVLSSDGSVSTIGATEAVLVELNRVQLFEAIFTGIQENPAITTRAFGSAQITLTGNILEVTGSFTGLEGDLATQLAGGGHIHEGLAGINGPISGTPPSGSPQGPVLLLDITSDNTNRNGTFTNTSILTDAQVELLESRSLYINIHSQVNLGGELRGQILPTSDTVLGANMSGSNEVPSIVAASSGNIVFDLLGNTLTASGSFTGLEGDIAVDLAGGAHIHDAVAGRNGQISIILNITAGADNRSGMFIASENTFELTDAQVALLLSQGNYVNIHSQANRGGELRGQIAPITNAAFRVQLAGIQEVPAAVNTAANGRLLVSYNTENNQLVVSGSYNGLQGTLATDIAGGIHLHTGIAGNNGPVTVLLNTTADDANNGVFLPENNTFNLNDSGVIVAQGETPASFVDSLFERGIYTNIHSNEFRGGELRGQLLPLAQGYFATNLESRNEIPLAISDAFGNIQFELRGNQLISSGSFSNLSSALNVELAGGAHGHLGNANQTGGIQFLLNTTPSDDNLSGVFEAANNIVTLTDSQREALLTGNIYINVHSLNNAPGEIRGQVLRDDNRFPTASNITEVNTNGVTISWEEATDPDEDILVYTLQGSFDDDFDALLLNQKLAETSFSPARDQAISLFRTLAAEFIRARRQGRQAFINLRVLSSDGSVSNSGETFEREIDIQLLRGLLLTRFTRNEVETEMNQLLSQEDTQEFTATALSSLSTSGVIILKTTGQLSSNLNVGVYDITGNLVYQNAYGDMTTNRTISMTTNNLPSGVYIVRMNDDNGKFISSKKVIVK